MNSAADFSLDLVPRPMPAAMGDALRTHFGERFVTSLAVRELLVAVQKNLVALMGEVACAESDAARYAASKFEKIGEADVRRLDEALAALEQRGLKFDDWATPGANARGAAFELARVAARRAERRLTGLPAHGRSVRPELRQFLNRLSDLLWLLAREAEQ